MPNHVTNHVCCDNLAALWELRDFNLIIPMPIIISKTVAGCDSNTFSELLAQGCNLEEIKKQVPRFNTIEEWERMVMRYAYCKSMYECITWYEWALANWGTKWNAYDIDVYYDRNEIFFNTAWSHPTPVIEALSRKYPSAVFKVQFADENIGYNAGSYIICNGQYLIEDNIECGSKKAFEIAFELWGGDDNFRWSAEDQTYVYIDN